MLSGIAGGGARDWCQCRVFRATSRTARWCLTAKLSTTSTTSCVRPSSRTVIQRRYVT